MFDLIIFESNKKKREREKEGKGINLILFFFKRYSANNTHRRGKKKKRGIVVDIVKRSLLNIYIEVTNSGSNTTARLNYDVL